MKSIFKSIALVTLSVLMTAVTLSVFGTGAPSGPGKEYLTGDVNGDGKVNGTDYILIMKHYLQAIDLYNK